MSQHTYANPVVDGHVETVGGSRFWLDRHGAMHAIAEVWDLDPADGDSWWIGAFGDGLAESVEALSRVVFSPRRGLVGGPAVEVNVFPLLPDSPARPVMIGVAGADGPLTCRGVEDVADCLPDAFGKGPDHVLDGLEQLLAVASGLLPEYEGRRVALSGADASVARSVDRARTLAV